MPKNYKEKQSKNKLKRKTHCDPITHHMGAGFVIAKTMHQPGIEPGSVPWQGTILPLDHWCLFGLR